MTREEAIEYLNTLYMAFAVFPNQQISLGNVDEMKESVNMAINALEQEPSVDLISKKSAKNAIYKVCLSEGNKDIFVKILDEINKLSSIEQEPSVEIVKTEESNDNGTKYLNINVSDGEVKRNPDIVRLCSDVGILEYMKPQTGYWIEHDWEDMREKGYYRCSVCGTGYQRFVKGIRKSDVPYIDGQEYTLQNIDNYCPNCGAKMVEPQESEE